MQSKDITLPSNLTSYQKEIEHLCFRPDDKDLAKAEILFIFGSSSSLEEMKKAVKQVLSKAKIKTLLISGGVSNKTFPRSEAQVIKDFICDILPKNLEIILEERATNTLENVLFSKKIYPKLAQCPLCFISKSFASGRTFLTLKKHLPFAEIFQKSFVSNMCSKENWLESERGKRLVFGEVYRIKTYSQKGDIEKTKELTPLLSLFI